LSNQLSHLPAVVVPHVESIFPLGKDLPNITFSHDCAQVFDRMMKGIDVRVSTPVTRVIRQKNDTIDVDVGGKVDTYDKIVFACTLNKVPGILTDPSFLEKELLGSINYNSPDSFNYGIIHSDITVIPEAYRDRFRKGELSHYFEQREGTEWEYTISLSALPPIIKRRNAGINDPIMLNTYGSKKQISNQVGTAVHRGGTPPFTFKNLLITRVLGLLQGHKGTYYCACGATPGNSHDISFVSGLVVAHHLSGFYPFQNNADAYADFKQLRNWMDI